jgi:KaiC/GvpD/RAD55 family RecA-like ATPase/tetratricopeptide (TPR) repeat protein
LKIFEEENSISDMGDALWRCGVVSTMYNDLREKGIGMLLRSIKIFKDQADVRKEITATYYAGVGFETCGLFEEAYQFFRRVLELGKNLDVFDELASSYSRLSREADRLGNTKEAISLSRQALDYCRKTDAKWIEVIVCARIARQYLKINDLDQAMFFMKKLDTYSDEDKTHIGISEEINGARFSFQLTNDEKAPLDAYFERFFEVLKKNNNFTSLEISLRTQYILCLEYKKRFEDAQKQREINQKILSQIETKYDQPKIQAFLVMPKEMQMGKEAELRLDFINISRKSTMLKRIENLQLDEFKIIEPQNSVIQSGILELKNKPIEPFEALTIKLRIIPLKPGSFQLHPALIFEKESHDEQATIPEPINFTVIEKPLDYEVLPGRRSIGYEQLDRLLLGGIPEKTSVIIAMPSSDERKTLTSSFLETGIRSKETTLLITSQLNDLEKFVKDEQFSFVIVCNSQADLMLKNSQNVSKLKGIENLTNIDIAVTRFFRTLKLDNPRRAFIDIISDVLLEHHALTSRKWLNGLLLNLKTNGFTTLALIDPQMHNSEEVQAILSLFDGEINMIQKENGKSKLKVKRLTGQKWIDE